MLGSEAAIQVTKLGSRSQEEVDEQGAEAAAKGEGAEQGAEAAAKEEGGEQEAVDAGDLGVDWDEPATEEGKANAAQEEETAAKEKEAEEAPEAQEGAGPANIRDRGAAPSWEAFRGDPDADGFFRCCVCGVKKQTKPACACVECFEWAQFGWALG